MSEWASLSDALAIVTDRTRVGGKVHDIQAAKNAFAGFAAEGRLLEPAAIVTKADVHASPTAGPTPPLPTLWRLVVAGSDSVTVDWGTSAAVLRGVRGRISYTKIAVQRADVDRLWPPKQSADVIELDARRPGGAAPVYDWEAALIALVKHWRDVGEPDLNAKGTQAAIVRWYQEWFANTREDRRSPGNTEAKEHARKVLGTLRG